MTEVIKMNKNKLIITLMILAALFTFSNSVICVDTDTDIEDIVDQRE